MMSSHKLIRTIDTHTLNNQNIVSSETSLNATLTDTLPINGWIKPCLICSMPTSKTYTYFKSSKLYNCYLCKDCYNKHTSIASMNKYIKKYIKRLKI